MFELKGKRILITGASSGIGKATAVMAAKAGAELVLLARREKLLEEIVNSLDSNGHRYYAIDLLDFEEVEKILKSCISEAGPIDGFVHSAGVEMTIPLKVINSTMLENVMKINTFSAFHISKILQKKGNINPEGGSFVFIASVMAALGQPAKIGYSASKGALVSGALSMALELASRRIRVNSILPGMVESEMSINLLNNLSEESVNEIRNMHPLGIGKVEDVANGVLFLLSDLSKWITGTSFFIDGGYSAK